MQCTATSWVRHPFARSNQNLKSPERALATTHQAREALASPKCCLLGSPQADFTWSVRSSSLIPLLLTVLLALLFSPPPPPPPSPQVHCNCPVRCFCVLHSKSRRTEEKELRSSVKATICELNSIHAESRLQLAASFQRPYAVKAHPSHTRQPFPSILVRTEDYYPHQFEYLSFRRT